MKAHAVLVTQGLLLVEEGLLGESVMNVLLALDVVLEFKVGHRIAEGKSQLNDQDMQGAPPVALFSTGF